MKKFWVLFVVLFATVIVFGQASKSTQDQQACEYARRNNSAEIWQDYLNQFPQGMCAFEAKSEIKKLSVKKQDTNSVIELDSGQAVIMGALDRSVIDGAIREQSAEIKWCYENELNKDPNLFGRIVINLIISETGAVSSSKVQRTTMGNARVESCVADQIKKIHFPAPRSGIVIVNYPFVFKNGN